MQFTVEEMDELLDLPKGKGRTFTLLSMIFPFTGFQKQNIHVDHIYPHSLFGRKKYLLSCGCSEEEVEKAQWMRNMLPNLQLLPGTVNREKSDAMPLDWLENNFSDEQKRKNFSDDQLLEGVTNNPKDFFAFFEIRRNRLRQLIAEKLGVSLEGRTK